MLLCRDGTIDFGARPSLLRIASALSVLIEDSVSTWKHVDAAGAAASGDIERKRTTRHRGAYARIHCSSGEQPMTAKDAGYVSLVPEYCDCHEVTHLVV